MKNLLDQYLVGNILLIIFGFLFVFHLLVLFGIVPYEIVWAGMITNKNEMVKMESISILILWVAAIVVAHKLEYLNFLNNATLINIGMWLLFIFFVLNTFGNLTAKNPIEKYGFGSLTIIIAFLLLRLAISRASAK